MRFLSSFTPTISSECSTSAPAMQLSARRRACVTRCQLKKVRPSSTQLTDVLSRQPYAGLRHSDSTLANNIVPSSLTQESLPAWRTKARDYGPLVDMLVKQTRDMELDLFKVAGQAAPPTDVRVPASADPLRAANLVKAKLAVAAIDGQLRRMTARVKMAQTVPELRDIVTGALSSSAASSTSAAATAASVTSTLQLPGSAAATLAAAGGMDAVCISAAFSQLPKLVRGRRLSDAERREITVLVEAQLLPAAQAAIRDGRFDAQGLVSVAVGLAKLDMTGAAAVSTLQLLVACSQPLLAGFTPQCLSNLIWALGTLEVQPSGAWLTDFYAAVDAAATLFNGQDIANTLWGLGRFDLMPEVELLELLLSRSLVQLGGLKGGRDAATVITCTARYFCKYNYKPRDEWLYKFMACTQPHLKGYTPGDLVSVVHSLVCMNAVPRHYWLVTFYDVLKDRLMSDPTLAYHDFSRLLGSLTRIDFIPTKPWKEDFVRVCAPKLSHLKYRALSELAWAMACWDCKPTPQWLGAYLKATSSRLAEFRPRQLSIVLSALSHLGCKVPPQWLGSVLDHFVDNINEAKAQDLVEVLESVIICDDAGWLAEQSSTFHLLADKAASKFSVFDAGMHVRLVVALARVSWGSPSEAWLSQQQAALVRCWRNGDVGASDAAGLRQAYASWEAEMDSRLEAEMARGELDTPAV